MGNSLDFVISSSHFFFFLFFFFMLLSPRIEVGAAIQEDDDCKESRCRKHGPAVRFPFSLRDHQPPVRCGGYPGPEFILSCTEQNDTVLELPSSVKLFVKKIDYKHQTIHLHDPNHCLPKQLLNLNLSASPFQFARDYMTTNYLIEDYTLFNCSSPLYDAPGHRMTSISCLSIPAGFQVYPYNSSQYYYFTGFQVYPLDSSQYYSTVVFQFLGLTYCRKIRTIRSLPHGIFYKNNDLHLSWSKPLCGNCEAAGKRCRLKNITEKETECFDIPKPSHRGFFNKLIIAGAIIGLFLLVVVLVIGAYHVWNRDQLEKQNQVKVEKFLEDYKALKPTRYSYADIKRITNQFKDKLGQGGHGSVYKGHLSTEISVAVKILDHFDGNGEDFINEVATMGTIHHVNVVRLVGFCADGFKRAIVYEFLPNHSLEKFIFTSTGGNTNSLGWEKLHDIALGIAKGIEYLHQGCDQRILHFDIKPHNILLDRNLIPKISDFGLAKLCSKDQSIVSMTTARGTMGYIAPEVFSRNFGVVSSKSDVYSFGMMLLEMVGGRKNTDTTIQNTSQVYFPEWIYNRLNGGEELEIQIEEEHDSDIARKLAIVGLWCIQWYPVDRPSMKAVIQMLDHDGESLTMPTNPFASTNLTKMSAPMNGRPLNKELEAISEID